MQLDGKEIWFRAKSYGWGWGLPCAWQGWIVFIASLAIVAFGIVLAANGAFVAGFTCCLLSIAGLVTLCFLKGEPPRWRWGKD
jgi:hypothetical protein